MHPPCKRKIVGSIPTTGTCRRKKHQYMNPQGLLRYGHTYDIVEKRAALMLQLYGLRL